MMRILRRLTAYAGVLVALALPLAIVTVPVAALAPLDAACNGEDTNASSSPSCNDSGSSGEVDPVSDVLNKVTVILSLVLGAIAVIFLIVGGFKYISASDSSSVASAKNTIIYALIGLLAAALARPIINLVVGKAT